jgi:hypothetical protein
LTPHRQFLRLLFTTVKESAYFFDSVPLGLDVEEVGEYDQDSLDPEIDNVVFPF